MIKQYLRETWGQPIGVMVADMVNGKLTFGWSVCHENDTFNKKKGDMIAVGRLHHSHHEDELIVPDILFDPMQNFMLRCQKYFQTEAKQYLINGYELSINLSRAKAHEACQCMDCDCCDESEKD